MSGWIGVDFDGTLATYYGWEDPDNGKPIQRMVDRVKAWIAEGKDVRIMTARVAPSTGRDGGPEAQRAYVQGWCTEHVGQPLPVTCVKDAGMIELWDDRAVAVERNEGRAVRWDEDRGRVVVV